MIQTINKKPSIKNLMIVLMITLSIYIIELYSVYGSNLLRKALIFENPYYNSINYLLFTISGIFYFCLGILTAKLDFSVKQDRVITAIVTAIIIFIMVVFLNEPFGLTALADPVRLSPLFYILGLTLLWRCYILNDTAKKAALKNLFIIIIITIIIFIAQIYTKSVRTDIKFGVNAYEGIMVKTYLAFIIFALIYIAAVMLTNLLDLSTKVNRVILSFMIVIVGVLSVFTFRYLMLSGSTMIPSRLTPLFYILGLVLFWNMNLHRLK